MPIRYRTIMLIFATQRYVNETHQEYGRKKPIIIKFLNKLA